MVERSGEDFLDSFHQNERQSLAHFLRHVFQVLLVRFRQNDPLNAGPVSRQHLFFNPTDWKDQSAEADLAGHRGIATDGFPLI